MEFQFNELSLKQKHLIMNLYSTISSQSTLNKLLSNIYFTNAVGTKDDKHHSSGLFATFSRINHSCLPNCLMYYEGYPTNCIIVKSLFDIEVGKEITICYIPRLLHTYDERQRLLINKYSFKCECNELCNVQRLQGSGGIVDKLILEYSDIICDHKNELQCVQRAIFILNEYFNGYPSLVTHLYNICTDLCIEKYMYLEAKEYIEKSIDLHLKCYGIYKRDRWRIINEKLVILKKFVVLSPISVIVNKMYSDF